MDKESDVVIVGGGPVGLWLACELALAKVKVTVLERHTERVGHSRAFAIHGRTLEVFGLRGLADRFLARGRSIPSGHFGALDTRLDFSVIDTRFPFMLLLSQATTEALLEERAREIGVNMRRGHFVEAVEQHADGVVVRGRNRETAFRFSARYVVGADGPRSIVRRAAAIDFVGHPGRHMMLLGDVVLDAPPPSQMVTIVNEKGGLLVAPLGDGLHHRIALMDAAAASLTPFEPLPLADLAAAAARIAGADFRPHDPIWLSRFTDETRLAERYVKGRILLAGDAAHIHAPIGGQGMNVGIQDAMNLGWKLASVVHGSAPEGLLETYERERWPVGAALHRNTLTQLGLFSTFDPSTLAMRRTFEEVLRVPAINRYFADEVSGFGVAYPEPLFAPDRNWEHREGVSGHRLPDKELVRQDGTRTTLYRLLEDGRWVRLQLASDEMIASNAGAMTIVALAPGANDGLFANLASVLVRPDGHLAHVRPATDARGAEKADTSTPSVAPVDHLQGSGFAIYACAARGAKQSNLSRRRSASSSHGISADDALACSCVRQAIAASFTNSAVRNRCECRARRTPFLGKQLVGSLRDESI
jgi:2-polyprenyl-6-methoxyphenol hydroxylase-like FAD-dependent oxidoreductase